MFRALGFLAMKVSTITSTASTISRPQVRHGASSGFSHHLVEAMQGVDSPAGVDTAPVTAVDSLLLVQEVGDATQDDARRRNREKAAKRGTDILDHLDELRLGLLSGNYPPEKVAELARLIRAKKENVDDPKLMAVLEEIELRAEVELAKFRTGV